MFKVTVKCFAEEYRTAKTISRPLNRCDSGPEYGLPKDSASYHPIIRPTKLLYHRTYSIYRSNIRHTHGPIEANTGIRYRYSVTNGYLIVNNGIMICSEPLRITTSTLPHERKRVANPASIQNLAGRSARIRIHPLRVSGIAIHGFSPYY